MGAAFLPGTICRAQLPGRSGPAGQRSRFREALGSLGSFLGLLGPSGLARLAGGSPFLIAGGPSPACGSCGPQASRLNRLSPNSRY